MRNFTDRVRAAVPGTLRFVNMLPDADAGALRAISYDSYVREFVATVQPDVLSFDMYPDSAMPEFFTGISMQAYLKVEIVNAVRALRRGIHFLTLTGGSQGQE